MFSKNKWNLGPKSMVSEFTKRRVVGAGESQGKDDG